MQKATIFIWHSPAIGLELQAVNLIVASSGTNGI